MKKTIQTLLIMVVGLLAPAIAFADEAAPKVIAYNGATPTPYDFSEATGTDPIYNLSSADSIKITGSWTDEQIGILRYCIKNKGFAFGYASTKNTALKKIDLSEMAFLESANNSFQQMCRECSVLKEIIFPASEITETVSLSTFFQGCSSLESIKNLENLKSISNLGSTFKNCVNLSEIRLAAMSINNASTFDSIKAGAKVYLYPSTGITDSTGLPANWKGYTAEQVTWVYGEPVVPPTVIAYNGSNPTSAFNFTNANGYTTILYNLSTYDSIVVSGTWTVKQMQGLRAAITNSTDVSGRGINNRMKKINLSDMKIVKNTTGNTSLCGLGKFMSALKEFIFPNTVHDFSVDFSAFFMDSENLESVVNLDKFTKFSTLTQAFEGCEKLKKIEFSNVPDSTTTSLYWAFNGCTALEEITNLDRFIYITSLTAAFARCESLTSISFATKEQSGSMVATSAFNGCRNLTKIDNFDKLTGINNLSYAFFNCNSLDTIRLAMPIRSLDSTKVTKTFDSIKDGCCAFLYATTGIPSEDSLPDQWKGYTNVNWMFDAVEEAPVLSSLTILSGGTMLTLTPTFNPTTLDYTATVANPVTSVNVSPYCEDKAVAINTEGHESLEVGANTVTVTLTKGNLSTVYTIIITRETAGASIELGTAIRSLSGYPNPVTNTLYVQTASIAAGTLVEVYDLQGHLVRSAKVAGSETEIDFSGLPKGTYIVRIGERSVRVVK